jgi:hypothetical protein
MGVTVFRYALRPAMSLVDWEDKEEERQTRYIVGAGAGEMIRCWVAMLLTRPLGIGKAIRQALKIGWHSDRDFEALDRLCAGSGDIGALVPPQWHTASPCSLWYQSSRYCHARIVNFRYPLQLHGPWPRGVWQVAIPRVGGENPAFHVCGSRQFLRATLSLR